MDNHRKEVTAQWIYRSDVAMIKDQGKMGERFADVLHRLLESCSGNTRNGGGRVSGATIEVLHDVEEVPAMQPAVGAGS